MILRRVLLFLLGVFACVLIGLGWSAIASADAGTGNSNTGNIDIWTGGNTDCTSQNYMHTGANPTSPANLNIPVAYGACDGSFAPFLGSMRANDAMNQGVDALTRIWKDNCSSGVEHCVMHGFSLGAPIVTIVGNNVGADQPGSNTHVITEGNAWAQPGVFGGKPGPIGFWINVGVPFTGLPLRIPQVSGSENRFNVNDGFADDATQNASAETTNLSLLNGADTNGDGVQDIPPQHWIQTGDPVAEFRTDDNVRQEVYGDPLPGVVPPQDNPVVNPELTPALPALPDLAPAA